MSTDTTLTLETLRGWPYFCGSLLKPSTSNQWQICENAEWNSTPNLPSGLFHRRHMQTAYAGVIVSITWQEKTNPDHSWLTVRCTHSVIQKSEGSSCRKMGEESFLCFSLSGLMRILSFNTVFNTLYLYLISGSSFTHALIVTNDKKSVCLFYYVHYVMVIKYIKLH